MAPLVLIEGQSCWAKIDSRYPPIVYVTWAGVPDVALIERYFAVTVEQATELVKLGKRCVMISDTRAMGRTSPLGRRRISELSRTHQELLEQAGYASCLIVENPLVRGVITALSWVDPTMDSKVVGTVDEAMAWATQTLKEAGAAVPVLDDVDWRARPQLDLRVS